LDETAVKDLLGRAAKVVAEANLPDDLRVAAFEKAVDLLDPRRSEVIRPAAPGGPSPKAGAVPAPAGGERKGSIEAALRTLDLDAEVLAKVVAIESDVPTLVVVPSALPSEARPAMRKLILVLTAVRQAGKWDELTDPDVIREALKQYPRHYDRNNFANALAGLEDSIRSTGGRDSKLKMLPTGYTNAAITIKELASPKPAKATS